MKITIFIVVFASMQTFAFDNYAQTKRMDVKIEESGIVAALEKIEAQSEFYFFYNNKVVKLDKKVSVDLMDKTINEILDALFKDTDIEYTINNRQIILSGKEVGSTVSQQQKSISGKVTDSSGGALPGVTVAVKGTTNGTITDANGNYSLANIPGNAILAFSFVGMRTQEVYVEKKTSINVVLVEETIGIEEVVAVGYGTQKKVNLTGAVDVITKDKLSNRQASTVSQLLQGLTPGANFTISGQEGEQPGAAMNITIRGIGSLNGGSPYTLINGIPGDINNLNPEDIESISVLKDAAASAIYGAKAAYGVILVTTKKGGKNEKLSATYTGTVSLATPPPLPKALDSYTWVKVQNEAGNNLGGRPFSETQIDRILAYQQGKWDWLRETAFSPGQTYFGAVATGNTWNSDLGYANTDWWDIYFGHSINQKHDFSLKGGTKNASYYFSMGYLGQQGYLNYGEDKFSRINLNGKIDLAIAPWWDFSWESRLANKSRKTPGLTSEGNYSWMFREISRIYPFVPLYDGWGEYMWESHIPSIEGGGTDSMDEIDAWNTFKTEIRPVKGWKINADFAYNYYQGIKSSTQKTIMQHMVDNTYAPAGVSVPNYLSRTHFNNNYWTTNIYSSYTFGINNTHHFSLLAGTQFELGNNSALQANKSDLILQDVPSLQTATGTLTVNEYLSHRALVGYFGRFNYDYKEKYLLESNVRYDGSYVFRKGNRWGFFPSFSFGWNVNKELFWSSIEKYINSLKLKLSWGELGNQNISPYTDLELLPLQTGTLNWVFGAGTTRPVGYTSVPGLVNKNLTWETATTKNIGTDMSFLNNRLTLNADLFERLTSDMVGPQEAKPGVLGASVPRANNSSLRTRGWELSLGWKQNFKNGLSYHINVNLSDYKSIVTKYYNPTETLTTWYEGKEVGEIWGFKVNDLFRTQEDLDTYKAKVNMTPIAATWRTGDIKIEDINSDGKINRGTLTLNDHGDLMKIGNDQPHYLYGISAGVEFKGFDFSMVWRGVAKKNIYFDGFSNIYWGSNYGWWESTLQPRTLDYFRDQPGTKYSGPYEGDANINLDGYFPRPYLNYTQEAKNKNNPNTRYLQNGSFLRLQNIQLGYALPQSIVSKLKLQKVRIAFSGENLVTFTKIPDGIDPVAPSGYSPAGSYTTYFGASAGVGRMTYGADRTYSFLVSVVY